MLYSKEALRTEQDNLIRNMIALVRKGHPAYQRQFRELGIEAGDIQSLDDLTALPITHKQDYMQRPEDYRLQIDDLSGPERTLWDVVYTTGTTTGKPTPFYTTTFDYFNLLEIQRRMAHIRGITSSDVIANLYPLTAHPHGAFLRANMAAMVLGAPLVTAFSGSTYGSFPVHRRTDEVVELLARTRATVLWGVPSYIRRVAVRAAEMGVQLPSVRYCAVSGEPCTEGMVAEIKRRLVDLGATSPTVNNSLGATEMQAGMVECREGGGFHNPAPDMFYFEVVDDAGRRLPNGETGLLTLTHLNRRGTVLLRYALGDLASLSDDPCPHCGHVGGRVVSQPFRTKGLLKIRGMLVNTELINQELGAMAGVLEYQSVITKDDPHDEFAMDKLVIRLAIGESESPAAVAEAVKRRIKAAIGVIPDVEFAAAEVIFDPANQMKPMRIIDKRLHS